MAERRRPRMADRRSVPEMRRFAALDFETANYTPASACAVGVVVVEDGRIVRRVSRLIRPPGRYFQFTWLHGIRFADVENEDPFPAVWAEIRPLLTRGSFVAAHNAAFDARVLAACLDHYGLDPAPLRFECTLKLARHKLGIRPTNLAFVCEQLSIPLRHHDPLSDAEAAARIVLTAMERKP
jgi:DNA polymerase III subunit epsilon